MATPTDGPMTAEEFGRRYSGENVEYIDGRVVVPREHDPEWADAGTPHVVRGEWPDGAERRPITVVIQTPTNGREAFSAMIRHLRAGEPAVVVLDPVRRTATVYTDFDPPRTPGPGDTLTRPEVLRGSRSRWRLCSADGRCYWASHPPSTGSDTPVVNDASADAR